MPTIPLAAVVIRDSPKGDKDATGPGQDRRGRLHRRGRQGALRDHQDRDRPGELEIEVEDGLKDGETSSAVPSRRCGPSRKVTRQGDDREGRSAEGQARGRRRELFADRRSATLRKPQAALGFDAPRRHHRRHDGRGVVSVISGLNAYVATNLVNLNPDVVVFTKYGIITQPRRVAPRRTAGSRSR